MRFDEAIEHLAEHASELGHLTIGWAGLHEALAYLFSVVVNPDAREIGLAAWNSLTSDRAQRNMLAAAVVARYPDGKSRLRQAIDLLLSKSDSIANARNNAVHAPFEVDYQQGRVRPSTRFGNKRAAALLGKDLRVELKWCRRCSEELASFARSLAGHIDLLHHDMITEDEKWFPAVILPKREDVQKELDDLI